MAPEKHFQVRQAPVVDIGVGPFESPPFRIPRPGRTHVVMDALLQVDPELALVADHDIGAHAAVERHIH